MWRSQFLFGIGRLFDLGPLGLVKLPAFFATLKLAVACICALHIADRVRCFKRGQPNSEILEAGPILIVLISIVSVGPASWAHSADLMREHTYQLLLAALATGLCIFERVYAHRAETTEPSRSPRSMRPRHKRFLVFTLDVIGSGDACAGYCDCACCGACGSVWYGSLRTNTWHSSMRS